MIVGKNHLASTDNCGAVSTSENVQSGIWSLLQSGMPTLCANPDTVQARSFKLLTIRIAQLSECFALFLA